jgi:uncharacterized protein (DUF983 family)
MPNTKSFENSEWNQASKLKPREIRLLCPSCKELQRIGIQSFTGSSMEIPCESCGTDIELEFSPKILKGSTVDRCALCGDDEFYVQKDFNRKLGVAIVGAGALIMLILIAQDVSPWFAYLPLVFAAIADRLLYRFLPNVQVCYNCDAVYRNFPLEETPESNEFDLAVHDSYKYWGKGEKKKAKEKAQRGDSQDQESLPLFEQRLQHKKDSPDGG